MTIGLSIAAVGMVFLTQLDDSSTYAANILPGLLIMGIGLGASMAPAMQGAISGVSPEDAGVASATVNTMQQVGGSVGTALLSTIASSAAASYATSKDAHATSLEQLKMMAAVHSYTVAFWVAAGVFALGALIAAVVIRSGPLPVTEGDEVMVAAH